MKIASLLLAVSALAGGVAFAEDAAAVDLSYARVRPGMVRISCGENIGTNADELIGYYSLKIDSPFHMDETEVTWGQWKAVREWAVKRPDIKDDAERAEAVYDLADVGAGKADDHPVVGVSWFDCLKWCNARSEKEGLVPCYRTAGNVLRTRIEGAPVCDFSASGYRLPTASERDYAARGGRVGARFPNGETISHTDANYFSAEGLVDAEGEPYDVAEKRGCHPDFAKGALPYTSPVKTFPPNGYGLYDMCGNVAEWIWASTGASRCTCGGSWDADAAGLRNALRVAHDAPGERADTIGFRTVRAAGQ